MNQEVASLGAELAVLAAKGTVSAISAKVKAIREKKNLTEMANAYEEVINELIQERNEAITIAQSCKAEIDRYQISDSDIEHLQKTIDRVLNIAKEMSPDTDLRSFELLRSLISVDTLKAMQMLGFDYRAGIGKPLTDTCAAAIQKKLSVPQKPQSINRKH